MLAAVLELIQHIIIKLDDENEGAQQLASTARGEAIARVAVGRAESGALRLSAAGTYLVPPEEFGSDCD